MSLRAVLRRAVSERMPRPVQLGLPVLRPARWGARCCRNCGAPTKGETPCGECQIPFSARVLNLKILLERKTSGVYRAGEDFDTPIVRAERWCPDYGPDTQLVASDLLPHDARWIAAAANVLPELLDEYDRLRAEVAELKKGLR